MVIIIYIYIFILETLIDKRVIENILQISHCSDLKFIFKLTDIHLNTSGPQCQKV